MPTTELKIKNENPNGASIRVQSWSGKVPTYDSEQQRGKALAAHAHDIDNPPAAPAPAEPVEALPEGYDKLKKAELVELAQSRKDAGKEIEFEESDTVAVLREKIEATYSAPQAPAEPVEEKEESAPVELKYTFKDGNLLQEQTLSVGQEKVFGIDADTFLTIKIDQ